MKWISKAVAVAACVAASAAFGAESDFRVTLLGTASPSPRPDRFGPSTLVEAGSVKLVIDAGRGVPVRLWQLRVPMGKIDALFVGPTGTKDMMANLERA